jgi:hypothetical protein
VKEEAPTLRKIHFAAINEIIFKGQKHYEKL